MSSFRIQHFQTVVIRDRRFAPAELASKSLPLLASRANKSKCATTVLVCMRYPDNVAMLLFANLEHSPP